MEGTRRGTQRGTRSHRLQAQPEGQGEQGQAPVTPTTVMETGGAPSPWPNARAQTHWVPWFLQNWRQGYT